MGKIVASLRRMGFDEVFDTVTGADLTVIEESKEFSKDIQRVKNFLYLLLAVQFGLITANRNTLNFFLMFQLAVHQCKCLHQ